MNWKEFWPFQTYDHFFLFISDIEIPWLNACQLHSPNHPPVLAFEICEGNDFHLQTNCCSPIEFLSRSGLSVVIKQTKMTQSAGGPASGKMLSISCQQWPLGLPSHGTGNEGIVSSQVWLRDHTGSIVSSSPGSYCSSVSGKRTSLHVLAPLENGLSPGWGREKLLGMNLGDHREATE